MSPMQTFGILVALEGSQGIFRPVFGLGEDALRPGAHIRAPR